MRKRFEKVALRFGFVPVAEYEAALESYDQVMDAMHQAWHETDLLEARLSRVTAQLEASQAEHAGAVRVVGRLLEDRAA